MQYKKLTADQKQVKRWRAKRNRLVSQLLAADPRLLREDALREANRVMRAAGHPRP
jgi:hypothetical protein